MKKGKLLGKGVTRKVYEHPENKNYVIKESIGPIKEDKENRLYGSNKREWEAWLYIKDSKYEKYFCPCIELLDEGLYLIMERAIKTTKKVNLPKELSCIKDIDIRPCNCGELNGRIVIIDYGHSKIKNLFKLNLKTKD